MAKGERCKNEENSPDLDQYAKDALDELFSKEQQTYEEFLEGFTFLKKGEEVKFDLMEKKPCTAENLEILWQSSFLPVGKKVYLVSVARLVSIWP